MAAVTLCLKIPWSFAAVHLTEWSGATDVNLSADPDKRSYNSDLFQSRRQKTWSAMQADVRFSHPRLSMYGNACISRRQRKMDKVTPAQIANAFLTSNQTIGSQLSLL